MNSNGRHTDKWRISPLERRKRQQDRYGIAIIIVCIGFCSLWLLAAGHIDGYW